MIAVVAAGIYWYVRGQDREIFCFVDGIDGIKAVTINPLLETVSFDGKDISGANFEDGIVSFRHRYNTYIHIGYETRDIWTTQSQNQDFEKADGIGECDPNRDVASGLKIALDRKREQFSRTSHPYCKDEASTKAYFEKFTTDMIANAAKIDPAKAGELQADMGKITEGVKEGDYGALCVKLDEIKAKYGI